MSLLGGDQIGKTLSTSIIRAGEPKNVSITIGERPREPRDTRDPRAGRRGR
jgi:hypothetical protein